MLTAKADIASVRLGSIANAAGFDASSNLQVAKMCQFKNWNRSP
jgi:hypothetical protein